MKDSLTECKNGDKVMLMNGTIAKIYKNSYKDCVKYPYYHDCGRKGFHGVDKEGKSCINDSSMDIVKVMKNKNNTITCEFEYIEKNTWVITFIIKGRMLYDSQSFLTKEGAIRSAKKYCEKLGFECNIKN